MPNEETKINAGEFLKWASDNKVKFSVQEDTRKYHGQQCQDEDINYDFRQLHKDIVNMIVKFCIAHNITIDEFHMSGDCMEESIKFGKWHAATDSSLEFDKFTQEYKDCVSMKNEESINKIKDEKEWIRIKHEQEPYLFSM